MIRPDIEVIEATVKVAEKYPNEDIGVDSYLAAVKPLLAYIRELEAELKEIKFRMEGLEK